VTASIRCPTTCARGRGPRSRSTSWRPTLTPQRNKTPLVSPPGLCRPDIMFCRLSDATRLRHLIRSLAGAGGKGKSWHPSRAVRAKLRTSPDANAAKRSRRFLSFGRGDRLILHLRTRPGRPSRATRVALTPSTTPAADTARATASSSAPTAPREAIAAHLVVDGQLDLSIPSRSLWCLPEATGPGSCRKGKTLRQGERTGKGGADVFDDHRIQSFAETAMRLRT